MWLLDTVSRPGAVRVLDPELVDLIDRHRVSSWLDGRAQVRSHQIRC